MSDDVWITLRTVDNFVHGYGLTWNAYERVQVFTHPLWTFFLSVTYGLFDEGYFTTLALSFALSMGVFVVAWRSWRGDAPKLLAFTLVLVSSKAFVDYSTSGLENPLTHLLAAVFFCALFSKSQRDPPTERSLMRMVFVASLAYFNRADTILAYAPALLWLTWRAFPTVRYRALRAWLVGTLPASGWTAFAVVYYGFPVPNTAFAKLAGGHYHAPLFHPHAVAYFGNSLRWDPVTLPVIGVASCVGLAMAFRRRSAPIATCVIGIALMLVYALRIGGDYMSGRLFALPFLLAAFLLVEALVDLPRTVLAGLVFALALFGPRSPTMPRRFDPSFRERDATAIIDDHALHHDESLVDVIRRRDFRIGRARQFEHRPLATAFVWGATGYHGFQSGPRLRTIDNLALSDALVARIPTRDAASLWGRGHLVRDLPEGYISSVEMGENRIVDPSLHAFYDKLLVITTGPLFTAERMRTIWTMNTGGYAHLVDEYESRRHVAR